MAANHRFRFKVGSKVQVTEGAGTDSRRVGTVVPRSVLKLDGQGIPRNVPGAYSTVSEHNWNTHRVIRYDNAPEGVFDVMAINYLRSTIHNPRV